MKKVFLSICLLLASFLLSGQNKKDIKAFSEHLVDMVSIHKDFYFPRSSNTIFKGTDKDSLLILTYIPKRIYISDFLISNHEVTNFEYRQFVSWVKDSICTENKTKEIKTKDIIYSYNNNGIEKKLNIYPDTSVWIKEFYYTFNEPLCIYYFNQDTYNNYPVVGISYDQANAYIHWLNSKLNKFLKEHNLNQNLCKYKLPSEIEWQYAAFTNPSNKSEKNRNLYPWEGSLFDKNGVYKANFGPIIDGNDVCLKNFGDDGFIHTSPVKSFKENYLGLYDMAGNVSEWVSDTLSVSIFEKNIYLIREIIPNEIAEKIEKATSNPPQYRKFGSKNMDSITRKIVTDELLTYSPDWNKIAQIITDPYILEQIKSQYYRFERDIRIIKETDRPGIIKGGSWLDPPVYMISCMSQVFPQSKGSSRLGFRVAMSINE